MEKPITFKVQGQQVVGMLHLPDGVKRPCPAVAFFHGFTGNKQESHRIFVKTARALAAAGIVALRIDFRGSGDSEGEFSQMTLSGEVQDARAALRYLRRRKEVDPGRIGILGLSMGGLVSALAMGEEPDLRAAVLWAPVGHPVRLARHRETPARKRQLKQFGACDYWGWMIGQRFIDELSDLKPMEAIAKTSAPVLLLHGSKDEAVPPSDTVEYKRALQKAGQTVVREVVRGADHTFSGVKWETQVLVQTVAWFQQYLFV